jgi:hypothetical protein
MMLIGYARPRLCGPSRVPKNGRSHAKMAAKAALRQVLFQGRYARCGCMIRILPARAGARAV